MLGPLILIILLGDINAGVKMLTSMCQVLLMIHDSQYPTDNDDDVAARQSELELIDDI